MTLKWKECVVSKNTVDSIEVAAEKPTTAVRPSAPTAPSATMTLTPARIAANSATTPIKPISREITQICSCARSSSAAIGITVSAMASSRNWMASIKMPAKTTNFTGHSGNEHHPPFLFPERKRLGGEYPRRICAPGKERGTGEHAEDIERLRPGLGQAARKQRHPDMATVILRERKRKKNDQHEERLR